MIPKIIHQVWLGGKPLPKEFNNYKKTWQELHPKWKYKMWNETNINRLKYFKKSDFNSLSNYSEKSDYLRFSILLEHGGVYIDTDVECLKNIEPILRGLTFFISSNEIPSINSAIMGSIKGQRLIKGIFMSFGKRIWSRKWEKYDADNKIGPGYIDTWIRQKKITSKERIFSPEVFEPIHWKYFTNGILRKDKANFNLEQSYAIHHFSGHWISPWSKFKKYIYNTPLIGNIGLKLYKKLRYFLK